VRTAGEKVAAAGEKVKETLVAAKDTVVGLPKGVAHRIGERLPASSIVLGLRGGRASATACHLSPLALASPLAASQPSHR
jgi:hypothetical protein